MSETVQFVVVPKMADRVYRLVKTPTVPPLGRQRQIVLTVMMNAKGEKRSVKQVADEANTMQFFAAAGTEPSVAWHLNEMRKRGEVEVVIG
jgi:hypothetical protein